MSAYLSDQNRFFFSTSHSSLVLRNQGSKEGVVHILSWTKTCQDEPKGQKGGLDVLLWVAEGPVPHSSATNATSHREVIAQGDRSKDSPNPLHLHSCILQQPDPDPLSHIPALQTDHRPSSLGSHLVTTLSPVKCHGNHKQINSELAPPSPLAAALQLSCAPCRDHCHQGAKNCP